MTPSLPPLPFEIAEVSAAFPSYAIVQPELGRGSFKVAYQVEAPDGIRVLKILTDPIESDIEEFTPEVLPERLARELEGMAKIDSPHIVRILDGPGLFAIGTQRYVCYEEPYYSGGTLAHRLEDGPLSSDEAEQLVVALLLAVNALWNSGQIVHRDIKPANIVYDSAHNPILLDLGIALYSTLSSLTASNQDSPKTPKYAAPEQFEVRRYASIDFRTDLFLIGVVAYEALTGNHPFIRSNISSIDEYLLLLLSDDPVDLSALPPCRDEFRAVLARLLAKRPNRRYRDISEPLRALGHAA